MLNSIKFAAQIFQLQIQMEMSSKTCEECGKCFSKPSFLRRHQVVHSAEKPFACIHCTTQFSQRSSLQRHIRIKHTLTAEGDSSKVAQHALDALRQLQARHTDIANPIRRTFEEQPPCHMVQLKDQLNATNEVHLLPTQCIRRQVLSSCFYVCEYCAKEFSKTYDLIRHRRTHTKEKPYPCIDCFKSFATLSKLHEHQKRLHDRHPHFAVQRQDSAIKKKAATDAQLQELIQLLPQPQQLLSQLRSYKCLYCEKHFSRKFNCRTHMVTHLRRLLRPQPLLQSISCLQCDKQFQKPSDLARHALTHSKLNKPHMCQVCQRRFTLKSTLCRHLQRHQPQRNYIKCQVCGKSYASPASLLLHLRLHTGEKPFSCDVCGETFRTSGHRLEHMRGERHKVVTDNTLII